MQTVSRPRWARSRCAQALAMLAIALASAGCDPDALLSRLPVGSDGDTVLAAAQSGATATFAEAEPNDTFATAAILPPLDETSSAHVDARLDRAGDIDVYALGPTQLGDRLTLTLLPATGVGLSVGVFDDQGRLRQLYKNIAGRGRTVALEAISHESATELYVVVTPADGSITIGAYGLTARLQHGEAPTSRSQVIVLNFDGASGVSIGGGPAVNVPAFDASRIDATFAGHTTEIRESIVANVRRSLSGLNVTLRASNEPGAFNGTVTVIHFGTYNPNLLGLADTIDMYNQRLDESAIIYTDTFALFAQLRPTEDEIAQAIANTASHEIGHLLGLWHVRDATRLMDVTATARQMLRRQTYGTAPLHESIFPLGMQDDTRLLSWGVGGALKLDASNLRAAPPADDWREPLDFPVDRHWFSSCLHCPPSEPTDAPAGP